MAKVEAKWIGAILSFIFLFGGIALNWNVTEDSTDLIRDNVIIAKTKWVVHAERSWIALDSWYDINKKCPKIVEAGGYIKGERCYYPDDYYEALSRSLKKTKITLENTTTQFINAKTVPFYMYGTRGAYAGYITETQIFDKNIESEQDFPVDYQVIWEPRDTRNYKAVYKLWSLKGEFSQEDNCTYTFGFVKVDLKDECDKLERVEVDESKGKADFYFKPVRGDQSFNVGTVDPTLEAVEQFEVKRKEFVVSKVGKSFEAKFIYYDDKEVKKETGEKTIINSDEITIFDVVEAYKQTEEKEKIPNDWK